MKPNANCGFSKREIRGRLLTDFPRTTQMSVVKLNTRIVEEIAKRATIAKTYVVNRILGVSVCEAASIAERGGRPRPKIAGGPRYSRCVARKQRRCVSRRRIVVFPPSFF